MDFLRCFVFLFFLLSLITCSVGNKKNIPNVEIEVFSENHGSVIIPAGMFIEGSTQHRLEELAMWCEKEIRNCSRERFSRHHRNEIPQREVYISRFRMKITEVSNGEYLSCVGKNVCSPIRYDKCVFFEKSGKKIGGVLPVTRRKKNHPVTCVSANEAQRYCAWRGGVLPRESQWEKAARGRDGRFFPWGNDWDPERLNADDDGLIDGFSETAPVNSFKSGVSPYGVLNMVGNVWEWAWVKMIGGKVTMRGGGFAATRIANRVAKRVFRDSNDRYENVGFRCVW